MGINYVINMPTSQYFFTKWTDKACYKLTEKLTLCKIYKTFSVFLSPGNAIELCHNTVMSKSIIDIKNHPHFIRKQYFYKKIVIVQSAKVVEPTK